MDVIPIVAPVFILIAAGYVAARTGLLSPASHKGLAEFAFYMAVPALLLRTIGVGRLPEVNPLRVWAAYFGAVALTWATTALVTRLFLRRPMADGAVVAIGSVYGNIVMLGIPLSLATLGAEAAGPMALILSVNTPLLWLAGTLHISWTERKTDEPVGRLVLSLALDLVRNPIVLGILGGVLLRLSGSELHPVADRTLEMLAQASVPAALVAVGASLARFEIKGQAATLTTMCVMKLLAMPALAWTLAAKLLELPRVAAGVVLLFAAMPAGANAYLFATRYQRVVNSTSGAVALGTVLCAVTVTLLIAMLRGGGG